MDFDTFLSGALAAFGALLGFMFGEIPYILFALMFAVVLDYITGIVAAASQGALNPSVGFLGIFKKLFIFCMIALAHILDMSLNQHVLMSGAILFYVTMEGLSIIKNLGVLNVAIPPNLIKTFDGFPTTTTTTTTTPETPSSTNLPQ